VAIIGKRSIGGETDAQYGSKVIRVGGAGRMETMEKNLEEM